MSMPKEVSPLKQEMLKELDHLLGWWSSHMIDRGHGGCYGRMDHDGQLFPQADKAIILHSRVLWTFATAAQLLATVEYRAIADHAYVFIRDHFIDKEHGGVYWMLDYRGAVVNDRKQIYAQAFTVYALAEYYHLSRDPKVLQQALDIFVLMEKHSFDPIHDGYLEAFGKKWEPIADLRLSSKDVNEAKTMNTHLHVLEAYTTLYRVSHDEQVGRALLRLIHCFMNRFIDPQTGHLQLFFDEQWKAKSKVISFGHDIEASWLLIEAVDLFEDQGLRNEARDWSLALAQLTLQKGLDSSGGLNNEKEPDGEIDRDKHWWPQAEAVVGFWNAWELSGVHKYQDMAQDIWSFIQNEIKDHKKGEWFWGKRKEGSIMKEEDKAGPWKAPYHNGRMCIEMIQRLSKENN